MLTEDEKRAAALAVSHYAADADAVQRVVQATLRQRGEGRTVDLIDELRRARLLDGVQVHDLRAGLEKTHLDPRAGNAAPPEKLNLAKLTRLGDCRVLRPLGEGGMGAVLLAFDERAKRPVALKVLAPELSLQQGYLDRFYREAKTGSMLDHPNLVSHYAWGQDR